MEQIRIKYVFLGDEGIGKTSLIVRYTKGIFLQYSESTIGCSFNAKPLELDNKKVRLDINFRLEANEYEYTGETIDKYYFTNLPDVDFSKKDVMIGYKFAISMKKSNVVNYFITYARGYKAGGVNQQPYLNMLGKYCMKIQRQFCKSK